MMCKLSRTFIWLFPLRALSPPPNGGSVQTSRIASFVVTPEDATYHKSEVQIHNILLLTPNYTEFL